MMQKMRVVISGLILILLLSACGGAAGQPPPQPPPEDVAQMLATITPTPAAPSANLPAATPEPKIGRAGPGEILFVREGQIWAIGPGGENERSLTLFPEGTVINDLVNSPTGQHLAFTVNSQQMMIYDLFAGTMTTADAVTLGGVGRPVWSPDGTALYYSKLVIQSAEDLDSKDEIWRAPMPPGSPPELYLGSSAEGGMGYAPIAALSGSRMAVLELIGLDTPDPYAIYDPAAGGMQVIEGYSLWDVSPDGSRVLLSKQDEVAFGRQLTPLHLYMGELSATEGVLNITPISPDGDQGVFVNARFAPDSLRVIAQYYSPTAEATIAGMPIQLVLLQPGADGVYQMRVLAGDVDVTILGFSWHSEFGIVAQRLQASTSISEIWLYPLAGGPGAFLAIGEQPVVVGGR